MSLWDNYFENKVRYVFLKDVANTIFKNDGMIFGGYVRDMIIHDHFAAKYYAKMGEEDPDNMYSLSKYNDTDLLPEYKERLKIPNDIDAFMTTQTMKNIVRMLTQSKKYIVVTNDVELSPYFIKAPTGLKHKIIIVKLLHNSLYKNYIPSSLHNMHVKIDALHMDHIPIDIEPPFSIDYECNALIMESEEFFRMSKLCCKERGLIGPYEHNSKLQDIIKDILERRAVPIRASDVCLHRTKRMVERGWTPTHPYTVEDHSHESVMG